MQKFRIIGFFFENRLHWQSEVENKFLQTDVLGCLFIYVQIKHWGHAVTQLVEALRYKSESRGFDSRWRHWNFTLISSFRPQCGPGVDSASKRNEEYFLGVNLPVYGHDNCTNIMC